MPSRDELTIRMPEIRYKSHFRWSLWVFFRKIQVRFKQASLATADNKQEDRMRLHKYQGRCTRDHEKSALYENGYRNMFAKNLLKGVWGSNHH